MTIDEVLRKFDGTCREDWIERGTAWIHRVNNISEDVVIGEDSVVGPRSSPSRGSNIGDRVTIKNMVILDARITIGHDATVDGWSWLHDRSIIGDRCTIGHGVDIGSLAAVGADSVIGGGTRVGRLVIIADHANIGDNVTIGEHTIVRGDVTIGVQSRIGAGVIINADSKIGPQITIGDESVIGYGFVTDDVVITSNPPWIAVGTLTANVVAPGIVRMGNLTFLLQEWESNLDVIAAEWGMSTQFREELRDWLAYVRVWMTRNNFLGDFSPAALEQTDYSGLFWKLGMIEWSPPILTPA